MRGDGDFPKYNYAKTSLTSVACFRSFPVQQGRGGKTEAGSVSPQAAEGTQKISAAALRERDFPSARRQKASLWRRFLLQAKKGKRKKRTFCVGFAMNTNFLLLFPFFGDILYSRNGCLRFASVDLQKSLLPLITIGDSECPFRSSRRILPEVAGSCRRFFCAERRKGKRKTTMQMRRRR